MGLYHISPFIQLANELERRPDLESEVSGDDNAGYNAYICKAYYHFTVRRPLPEQFLYSPMSSDPLGREKPAPCTGEWREAVPRDQAAMIRNVDRDGLWRNGKSHILARRSQMAQGKRSYIMMLSQISEGRIRAQYRSKNLLYFESNIFRVNDHFPSPSYRCHLLGPTTGKQSHGNSIISDSDLPQLLPHCWLPGPSSPSVSVVCCWHAHTFVSSIQY